MARVLILSSWVAHGHVGLGAATPALQALGHSVTQLPMTILSNHPGWPHVAGQPLPCDRIAAMIGALDDNGWLDGLDAVLTGYMPGPDHAALAAGLIARLRAGPARPRVVVDPVLGDDPGGLYLPAPVADAVRDLLVPLADTLTPNLFELGWLTGMTGLTGRAMATPRAARAAARALARPGQTVLATSAPAGADRAGLLSVGPDGARLWSTPRQDGVPHGVGDVFSALIAAGLPPGAALGHLSALIGASLGAPHLRIAESATLWTRAAPLSPHPLPET